MDTHWFWGDGPTRMLVRLGISIGVSCVFALGLCHWAVTVNSDRIEACETIGGELTVRGFNCELPTGEIVNPLKWSEKGSE